MLRYVWLRALVGIGGRLPVGISYPLSGAMATMLWFVSRAVRETTRDHARHVLGPGVPLHRIDGFARAMTRSAGYYYADFSRQSFTTPESVFDQFDEIVGIEHLFRAYDEGRGVVIVGAHLGGTEMLAQAVAPFGICFAAVAEPLSPPRVHRYVQRIRDRQGVRFLPATPAGLRASIAHLRGGGSLGLLVDRDVLGTANRFPFFGERAPIPSGAVELARRTGAPMLIAWVPRSIRGRYRLYIEPIDLPEATGDRRVDLEAEMLTLTRALEAGIARWPGQWFPLTPVWGKRD